MKNTERFFDPRGGIAEYGYFTINGLVLQKIDEDCRVVYRVTFPTMGDKQMFVSEHCGRDFLKNS
jgi:hypothetical protein